MTNRSGRHSYFRFRDVHHATLASELLELESWRAEAAPLPPAGELFQLWSKIPGGHKWHHYFPIYERIFGELRQRPIRLLEIGVYQGASVQLWRRYFHPESVIVGIDIDPNCMKFDDFTNDTHVRVGSQADKEFLARITDEFGPFDLIIDDGSHIASDMIASFNYLFTNGLTEKGIYFVEDTHTNYAPWFRNTEHSFMEMAKALVDVMHAHYVEEPEKPPMTYAHHLGHRERLESITVPRLTRWVDEIRFFDSIVVFYRRPERALSVAHHL